MEVGLVILDGWGLNPDEDARDAVAAAATPQMDRLETRGATGTLATDGRHVGLPAGQMGNSEVGHLTIGAGRVVTQESARITDAVARWRGAESTLDTPRDPPLGANETLASAFAATQRENGRLHLVGLVSDGGVHSDQSHLHALVDLAADRDVDAVTHAVTDGRDTAPKAGVDYLRELESHARERGTGEIATVSGRYYAMDRDENWERTRRVYDAIVNRESEFTAPSGVAAVEDSYERETTDEFVEPTCIEGAPALADGDTVVVFNFRADRARQLTRLLADIDPVWPPETDPPDTRVVTMTEYDEGFDLPVAFPPRQPTRTLGAVLAETGHTQLRVAETEKYAHVTYFFNGGRERRFEGENREIVPSPDVPTYDHQPEMSAHAVTDTAVEHIETDDPDVVVLNYANPDMVGHTGEFEATRAAVEAVDDQLGRLVGTMRAAGGTVFVTADHGNADEMGTPAEPHTAHTTNPVPFVALSDDEWRVRDEGELADIAPTVLGALGVVVPEEMTGTPLLE